MTDSEIEEYLVGLDDEISKFKEDLFRISWYMRGGVTVNDLLHIYSFEDRDMIYEIINDNIKTTQDTRMPLL